IQLIQLVQLVAVSRCLTYGACPNRKAAIILNRGLSLLIGLPHPSVTTHSFVRVSFDFSLLALSFTHPVGSFAVRSLSHIVSDWHQANRLVSKETSPKDGDNESDNRIKPATMFGFWKGEKV